MRTLILALTVLLFAAPVWATVTITAQLDGTDSQKVWIGYTSDEAELVRAFALDLSADSNIVEVNDYAVGDDNGGYGIFPGTFAASITVNPTTGMVDNWNAAGYSPVAPASDPDALGGIGTMGVTVEMGSLYDTAAPGNSGILCSVTMEAGTSGNLCVAANAIRGNVVLESAAEASIVLPDCVPYGIVNPDCFPSTNTTFGDWVSYGKPDCWCNPYQCDGDGGNDTQGVFKYRVYTNDLNLIVPEWKKKIDTANPCADYDHKGQGVFKYRVYTNDLQKLIDNWKKKDGDLPGDCQTRPE